MITPTDAKQHLDGPQPSPTAESIVQTVQSLGCLQLDPISAVERGYLLVLPTIFLKPFRFNCFVKSDPSHWTVLNNGLAQMWLHRCSIATYRGTGIRSLMFSLRLLPAPSVLLTEQTFEARIVSYNGSSELSKQIMFCSRQSYSTPTRRHELPRLHLRFRRVLT